MKKLGAKEICGVVVAAGVCVCMLVYVLVFNKYNELTDELKSSNAALEAQVNDMKQYFDNIDFYRTNITQMKETIADLTKDYPGDAREEDAIMMAVAMQGATVVNFEKINIAGPETIYSIPQDVVKGLNDETLQTDINFKARQAGYTCNTDYAGLKALIEQVYNDDYRVGINTVAFQKDADENNFIKGTIDISYYSLSGMNKEYNKPDMASYIAGVMDLFPATITDGGTVAVTEEEGE